MKLSPVVAALISAASAEDKTCLNGIMLQRYQDKDCLQPHADEKKRQYVVSQEELDERFDTCFVHTRVDSAQEKASLEDAQTKLMDAYEAEKVAKKTYDDAQLATIAAVKAAEEHPYNVAVNEQAAAVKVEFTS